MHNLDQAREWANRGENLIGVIHPDAQAAIEIIQSLPDQWVDVGKVREVISGQLSEYPRGTVGHCVAEEIARDLEALLATKLPTLADMTQEERESCKGMQADSDHFGRVTINCVLDDAVQVMNSSGWVATVWEKGVGYKCITPLPDLPKLQWPGDGVVDSEIVDETPDDQQPNSSETPKSSPQPKMGEWWQVEEERNGKGVGKLVEDAGDYPWLIYLNDGTHDFFKRGSVTPITRMVPEIPAAPDEKTSPDQAATKDVCNNPRPEDVPADELWLVEHGGLEFLAKRNREDAPNYPWFITSVNGMGSGIAGDVEITLIHKLVPETHTLPEGMRLADHERFGRVVVSPRVDMYGRYSVFYLNYLPTTGSSCQYVNPDLLTFLDGEA